MDRTSHYPELADHARRLADATWQEDLEELLRRLARDFDDIAEDIGADMTEASHPGPPPEAFRRRSPPSGRGLGNTVATARNRPYGPRAVGSIHDCGKQSRT